MLIFDAEAMAIGYEFVDRSNRYRLVEMEPYERKSDGQPSVLFRWLTACYDCEASFTFITGRSIKSLPRRCLRHRDHRTKTLKNRNPHPLPELRNETQQP
jgi:hypothetical protein